MVYNAILVKKGFQHQLFLEQSYCSIVDLSDELDFCISCNYCGDYTENTRFHCLCWSFGESPGYHLLNWWSQHWSSFSCPLWYNNVGRHDVSSDPYLGWCGNYQPKFW